MGGQRVVAGAVDIELGARIGVLTVAVRHLGIGGNLAEGHVDLVELPVDLEEAGTCLREGGRDGDAHDGLVAVYGGDTDGLAVIVIGVLRLVVAILELAGRVDADMDASQVELVDIEPQELIERLQAGKVYNPTQAESATENFFTVENLMALREIALRRCADRVNLLTETVRTKSHSDYHTDEHILVCLSSSPSNAKIIRTAARIANAFKGAFTALFVKTPDYQVMSEEDVKRLRNNMHLAEQLGAKIETVYGEDVSYQIAEFARLSGVSKIVIGRSSATRKSIFSKPTLTEKLIANAPNLDVHIIPNTDGKNTA